MGKWLSTLQSTAAQSGQANSLTLQNPQNLAEVSFEGFEGGPKTPLSISCGHPLDSFDGFEGEVSAHVADLLSAWDALDWQVAFDERAAILEYDEGLPRTKAAFQARQEINKLRSAVLRWVRSSAVGT
jgi:hypothetical protein